MPTASTAPASGQVLVGASGTVYLAPVATAAPTSESSALNAAFIEQGFISADGVTIRDSKDVAEVTAWQTPYAVRRLVTGRTFEVEFALEQVNWSSLPFAMGGGTLSEPTAGHYKYLPPDADDLDPRAMVIEWADGASRNYRLYIPQGIVTAPVEFTVKRDEAAMFPITFGAIFDGTNDVYTLFSDDVAFEV